MAADDASGSKAYPYELCEQWAWHCGFPDWAEVYKGHHALGRWTKGGSEGSGGQLAQPIGGGYGIYLPFACNVCARNGFTGTKLLTCGGCGIVKYCCREHQLLDWPAHKLDCKALRATRARMPAVPADARRTAREWDTYVLGWSQLLMEQCPEGGLFDARRQMQMVMRQPKCLMCFAQVDLEPCASCHSVAVCKRCRAERTAEEIAAAHPPGSCEELLVALCCMGVISDFRAPIQMPSKTPSDELWTPASWIEYLLRKRGDFDYEGITRGRHSRLLLSLPPFLAHLSDGLSLPLTIVGWLSRLYGNQRLGALTSVCVHIIDVKLRDVLSLEKYAEISNMMPALQQLTLVFVGPELNLMQGGLLEQRFHRGLEGFGRASCRIEALTDSRAYDAYAQDERAYRKPTVAVIANTDLDPEDGRYRWPPTVQALTRLRTPTICTSMTEESCAGAIEAAHAMGASVKSTPPGPVLNPFRGMRPHIERNPADGPELRFMNQYMFII